MTRLFQIAACGSCLIVLLLVSCTNDATGPSGDGVNLISNSSFESDGKQSLATWYVNDSSTVTFSKDTPSQGGNWSLELRPGWIPSEGYVRTILPIGTGSQALQLTLWARIVGQEMIGTFGLGTIRNGEFISSRVGNVNSYGWTQYTMIDTIAVRVGDSLAVKLSAGLAELARPSSVLFDLIRVEKMR